MLVNNEWITKDIKEEIKKKYLEANENKNTIIHILKNWIESDLELLVP